MRSPLLRAALAAALLALPGCGGQAGPAAPTAAGVPVPADAQQAVVVRPVDGDTLVLRGRGSGPLPAAPTRVRVLLVDAPELGDAPECLGPEAAVRLSALAPAGATVRVQADRDREDRFGRALLHVWGADGRSVGEVLVRDGLATVLVLAPNRRYEDAFRAAERQARTAGRGLWTACR